MKMRLLNGSHLAMAYLGALRGFTYVHEIMADPLFTGFIGRFMDEVTPVVPKIAGVSVADYKKSLIERFSNPTINDQVTRICSEGSAKLPKWLPSIVELWKQSGDDSTELLSLVVASWIRYLSCELDERGRPIQKIDARADELTGIAGKSGLDPHPMLAVQSIFGTALPSNGKFVGSVESAIQQLAKSGVAATIDSYLV